MEPTDFFFAGLLEEIGNLAWVIIVGENGLKNYRPFLEIRGSE